MCKESSLYKSGDGVFYTKSREGEYGLTKARLGENGTVTGMYDPWYDLDAKNDACPEMQSTLRISVELRHK